MADVSGRITKSIHIPMADWAELSQAIDRVQRLNPRASFSGYVVAAAVAEAKRENARARKVDKANGDES